ncbi:MAG: ankyrin repeat domain-containing protein [Betaproteobacteria bacterium]
MLLVAGGRIQKVLRDGDKVFGHRLDGRRGLTGNLFGADASRDTGCDHADGKPSESAFIVHESSSRCGVTPENACHECDGNLPKIPGWIASLTTLYDNPRPYKPLSPMNFLSRMAFVQRSRAVLVTATFLLVLPGIAVAQNMGDKDFDADAYNLNAQLLAVAKRGDSERALALVERGAAVNARNRVGETPLMLFVKKGDLALVQILIARGADPNIAALNKTTPLMAAAIDGRADLMQVLIDASADPLVPDQLGKTAMVYAAGAGRADAVRLLLDRGIDVNAIYLHRLTALMWAAGYGKTDTVRLLLDRGADASLTDDRGKTARLIAQEGKHTEAAALLGAARP